MELVLTHQTKTEISVSCDGQSSHLFDLQTLILKDENILIDDPIEYGKKLYEALFPPDTPAQRALAALLNTPPGYLLLVAVENDLDVVPWEYVYGPDGFLILECHFARGLPAEERIAAPTLDTSLHIVAIPSNPLSHNVEPLDIDGEWTRLKEIIQQAPYAITLERTRPPTIRQVRNLVANQRQRIIHFMGHGGQDERGALLYFEKDNGDLDPVTARQFILRVRGSVFLVTLNACVSATPGATFSNLAAALTRQKTPYALGMRFSVLDEDARTFSRVFYSDLARGSSVEEALLQARLTLANSSRPWTVGVPVLYTALAQPADGFALLTGTSTIKEHLPKVDVSALPRVEGIFQGRVKELKQLGDYLTSESSPRLITIHGCSGQGKTVLAREAVERFAHAWPGGVWAVSLENLPSRQMFVNDLASFLGIDIQDMFDPNEVERLVRVRLAQDRQLIVLDNAEMLVEAVMANDKKAVQLAQFIRDQLPRPMVSLLATSRSFLGWANEIGCELGGVVPIEGVKLFQQHAPQRTKDIDRALLWELSEKVEGHPLSLLLLSSTFNASTTTFQEFVKGYQTYLQGAENKYSDLDDHHRTLYASIETSVHYLSVDLRSLLSGLWVFDAPFLLETVETIFDSEQEDTEDNSSLIHDHIDTLWQRGFLVRERTVIDDGIVSLYRLLPLIRSYVKLNLEQAYEREALYTQFGNAYFQLAYSLHKRLGHSALAVFLIRQTRPDLEQNLLYVTAAMLPYYLLHLASLMRWLGDRQSSLAFLEQALEIFQGQDREAEAVTLEDMADMYRTMGQLWKGLECYEKALTIISEIGDKSKESNLLTRVAMVYHNVGKRRQAMALFERALAIVPEVHDSVQEGATLNNIAEMYRAMGQLQHALEFFEQALALARQANYHAGEATTLSNIALVYHAMGKSERALELFEQALPIAREVSDRPLEGIILTNIAGMYLAKHELERALEAFEQVLPIMREVSNKPGEAVVLNNMANAYRTMGQLQRALALFKQALLIRREIGNRPGESATLSDIGLVYYDMGQPERALGLFEQALVLAREVSDRAGEASILGNTALLLHQSFNRSDEAIVYLEQAIAILVETGLLQSGEGRTIEDWRQLLEDIRSDVLIDGANDTLTMLPTSELIQAIHDFVNSKDWDTCRNVIESQKELLFQPEVEEIFEQNIERAKGDGDERSEEILRMYLAFLRDCKQRGIAEVFERLEKVHEDDFPFDAELVPRSISALVGSPQERRLHAQYLATLSVQAKDEELKSLIDTIQLALFGGDLLQLGQHLNDVYRQAWEAIVVGVETEGVDPDVFNLLIHNTLLVLGPAIELRNAWRDDLLQMKNHAAEQGVQQLIALLDAIIGLLDANGNPAGLGTGLKGAYTKAWQTIVARLTEQ